MNETRLSVPIGVRIQETLERSAIGRRVNDAVDWARDTRDRLWAGSGDRRDAVEAWISKDKLDKAERRSDPEGFNARMEWESTRPKPSERVATQPEGMTSASVFASARADHADKLKGAAEWRQEAVRYAKEGMNEAASLSKERAREHIEDAAALRTNHIDRGRDRGMDR